MAILINKNTKIITQGITGKTGSFHTNICKNYANGKKAFLAGVNPNKKKDFFQNIPIYKNVYEAKKATKANTSIIYVPAEKAVKAIWEAVVEEIELIICITEGIPIHDMLILKNKMAKINSKTMLLGPNCPGVISPNKLKIGIMPEHIHKKGNIGVVSRSGTLTYEIVYQLTKSGLGQSTAVGIGGDPINGLNYIDIMNKFNKDDKTHAVVMIGEIGGTDESKASKWIKKNMIKPVVGFIAGITAPVGKRMGHAGAIISKEKETAEAKLKTMEECGIKTTRNLSKIGNLIKSVI